MSHRAAVVFPTDAPGAADKRDIHRSGNGAFQLNLLPILEECTARGEPRRVTTLDEIPDVITRRVAELQEAFGNTPENATLVEPDPMRIRVPAEAYAEVLDFLRFEAVYEVAAGDADTGPPGGVETYLPIFVDLGVVPFFARFIDLAVYATQDLPTAPDEALQEIQQGEVAPEVTIAGTDYLELSSDTTAKEFLIDGHMGILQMLYSLGSTESSEEVTTVVTTEDHFIVGTVDATGNIPLPDPFGKGILVRLPREDFAPQQLATLYSDWAYLANRLRIEHSLTALQELIDTVEGASPASVDTESYVREFLQALDEEFGPEISPLTPSEFHSSLDSL